MNWTLHCLDRQLTDEIVETVPQESAHALAYAMKIAKNMPKDKKLLINMSGRGDKDLDYVCDLYGERFGIGKEGLCAGPPSHEA